MKFLSALLFFACIFSVTHVHAQDNSQVCSPSDFSNADVLRVQALLVQNPEIILSDFKFSFVYDMKIGSQRPNFKVKIKKNLHEEVETIPIWRFDCDKKLLGFGLYFPLIYNFYNSYNAYTELSVCVDLNTYKLYAKLSGRTKKDIIIVRNFKDAIENKKIKNILIGKLNNFGKIKLTNPTPDSVFNSEFEKNIIKNVTIEFIKTNNTTEGVFFKIHGEDTRLDGVTSNFVSFSPIINSQNREESNVSFASWFSGAIGVRFYINGIDLNFGKYPELVRDTKKLLIVEFISQNASSFFYYTIQ